MHKMKMNYMNKGKLSKIANGRSAIGKSLIEYSRDPEMEPALIRFNENEQELKVNPCQVVMVVGDP